MKTSILEPQSTTQKSRKSAFLGQPLKQTFFAPIVQPKLTIGSPNDVYEQEADAVADTVVRKTEPSINPTQTSGLISRKCAACEEEEKHLQKKGNDMMAGETAPSIVHDVINSGNGKSLDTGTQNFMESRFGHNFSNVRIHTNSLAADSATAIQAKAYTIGNHVVFNTGEYAPHTHAGKHLLAHELTHVVQQGGVQRNVQRTSHSGNPCNCHNWFMGLPPWLAGTYAHGQIAALFLAGGIHPQAIPRATKLKMGTPLPPTGTIFGFADLWKDTGATINIAEIKSTAAGDGPARAEAAHYILRHDEWLSRLSTGTATDRQDTLYSTIVGGPKIGGTLDISSFTGTGIALGPFIGDPTKILWVEGDSMGSVVYWCTGLLDPLLMAAIAAAIVALKLMLEASKRVMEEALVLARQAWELLSLNWEYVVLAVLLIVAIVLIIIYASAILAFLTAVAAAVATAVTAAATILTAGFEAFSLAFALLALVGINLPEAESAGLNIKSGLLGLSSPTGNATGADYERNIGGNNINTSPAPPSPIAPTQILATSLASLANPMNLYEIAKNSSGATSAAGIARIRQGISVISNSETNSSIAQTLTGALDSVLS